MYREGCPLEHLSRETLKSSTKTQEKGRWVGPVCPARRVLGALQRSHERVLGDQAFAPDAASTTSPPASPADPQS